MAYVRDVMRKEFVAAKINESVQRISKILMEKKVSNVPVIDEHEELVGVVSEQDIIKAMGSENIAKMTAKDIMTKDVLSVKESDCLEYVSKIFVEKPYRRLPVTRDKKVVGVVTREDIINNFMSHYY
jgi:CBS domain-containing protein